MNLPQEFISNTSSLFGKERWQCFADSFSQEPVVSVRFNPWKYRKEDIPLNATLVPWCKHGFWLQERPNFTQDPLFHAGVYYVQEAGSMFLDQVLRHLVTTPVSVLDLCAAPGGKSTLMRAALPEGSALVSNETDRRRSNILLENMLKQGHPGVMVTHNTAKEFSKTNLVFDVILTDVPCSGEGLFRRDCETVQEWSPSAVHFCQERQRQILQDIWPCLREGGLLIYSTCTFNLNENEENVRWIQEELGADLIAVPVQKEWNITGSLLKGWEEPVYRFIPGITPSEGLFMAVLRKKGAGVKFATLPSSLCEQIKKYRLIHLLSDGIPTPEMKGKEQIPSAAQALSLATRPEDFPQVQLPLDLALRYLHRESFSLPEDTARGFVRVMYQGRSLGFMKNLGGRANNLYPKPWAIRKL
ncbi:MAG: rRNA cytosine-C5-methyltransferase [Elusimicrobiaceae bacterium]|nr:rRNA cytosine-C5-methyltransferase [Elusimicrobiaceae bacterium]